MESALSTKTDLKSSREIIFPVIAIGFIALSTIFLSQFENSIFPDIFIAGLTFLLAVFSPAVLLGKDKFRKTKILIATFVLIWLAIFSIIPLVDLLLILAG